MAMGTTMHVEVVSAEESIYSGPAEFLVAPGEMGELGIYPRHTPLLTRIKPGALRIKVPLKDEEELVVVSGGILEVQPSGVTVLADTAVRAADLDEAKALEAKRAAEEALQNKTSKLEIAKAQAELAEAAAQLAAIQKLRKARKG
jgi:F-type H+-transporting ATPase subunit epsilon